MYTALLEKVGIKSKPMSITWLSLGLLCFLCWSGLGHLFHKDTMLQVQKLLAWKIALSTVFVLGALISTICILYKQNKQEKITKKLTGPKECIPKSNSSYKNDNVKYNRNLVAEWRKMVHEIANLADISNESVTYLLERHDLYYSLKPHLSQNTIKQITSNTIFISGTTIPSPLQYILNDIADFEKNKGLI